MTGLKLAFGFLMLLSGIGVLACGIDVLAKSDRPATTINFVAAGSGPYWQLAAEGARAAARDQNVELRMELPRSDGAVDLQSEIDQRLSKNEPDGVAICMADSNHVSVWIARLAKDRLPLAFLSDVPDAGRHFLLGRSDISAGRQSAHAIESLPRGGEILALVPAHATRVIEDRLEGFRESLRNAADGEGGTMLSHLTIINYGGEGDVASAGHVLRRALARHPAAAYVMSFSNSGAAELAQVVDDLNLQGQVRVISFDQSPGALAEVAAGRVHAVIADDPFATGYAAVAWTARLCRTDRIGLPAPGKGQSSLRAVVLRKENMAEYRAHPLPAPNMPRANVARLAAKPIR
jgi:ABC-type sugar transport system substrate-binding protein